MENNNSHKAAYWREVVLSMKADILEFLDKLEPGYGHRKKAIVNETGIPMTILTPVLKEMKEEGTIDLLMIWSEDTGRPNGSGYCIKDKGRY